MPHFLPKIKKKDAISHNFATSIDGCKHFINITEEQMEKDPISHSRPLRTSPFNVQKKKQATERGGGRVTCLKTHS